VVRRSDNKT